jgi:hypothetical protein
MCFLFCNLLETFFDPINTSSHVRDERRNARLSSRKVSVAVVQFWPKLVISTYLNETPHPHQCHWNQFSSFRALIGKYGEANRRIFATSLQIRQNETQFSASYDKNENFSLWTNTAIVICVSSFVSCAFLCLTGHFCSTKKYWRFKNTDSKASQMNGSVRHGCLITAWHEEVMFETTKTDNGSWVRLLRNFQQYV